MRRLAACAVALWLFMPPALAGSVGSVEHGKVTGGLQLAQAAQTSPSVQLDAPVKKKPVKKVAPAGPAQAVPAVTTAQTTAPETKAAPGDAKSTPIPPIDIVVLMLRSSLIALDQANKTNNYSVLRVLSGPSLQAHTPEELSQTFAVLRQKQIDLSPALVTKPKLTANPAITADGNLRLAAIFPTKPLMIRCLVEMQPVAGFWRLAGISVNLEPLDPSLAPANPTAKPAAAAAPVPAQPAQ